MSTFERNLSEGSVTKNLIKFALPFLISNLVQSLYNVADMLIVGNYCGPAAMSGVNIGGQITFILTNIIFGLCTGATVLIAQYIGAKETKRIGTTIATLLTMLILLGVVITVVSYAFKEPILRLIQTPEESFSNSNDYLSVTLLGIIFIFGYNALSAVLRGMGDSKRPFYFVLVACIVNIILDLVLVAGLKMGAYGAALATVISQGLSMLLCVFVMVKSKFYFDFKLRSFRIDKHQMKMIVKIGLPNCVQNGVTSISFLFITALVNGFGVAASAAVGAVGKFNGFAIMPAVAMSASISTIAAQNIGADKWDRAVRTCRIGVGIAASISLLVFAVVQLFPEAIIRAFGEDGE